jgi:hypothetical protein
MSFFDKAKEAVVDKLKELERDKDALVDRLKLQALEFKAEKEQMIEQFAAEKKQLLVHGLVDRYNNIFEYIFGIILATLKEMADDPYMPRFVKSMVDDVIEAFWPGVKNEVRTQIITGIVNNQPLAHGEKKCCLFPRPFFRYVLYPYDRNLWRVIRHPVWWFCLLLSICPFYSISQIYYILMFFIIDKRDQFQLENYITEFKAFQFISLGLVSALVGSVQYFICTSLEPMTCPESAPRVELYVLAFFVIQIIFAWAAFALVNCSQKKGGLYYQQSHLRESDHATRKERQQGFMNVLRGEAVVKMTADQVNENEAVELRCRHRLMALLCWDTFVFVICLALGIWATLYNVLDRDASVTENEEGARSGNWKWTATLFWIRALYGILSFPFLAMHIPGVSAVFSHAKPTGYNPWGHTVPYLGHEEDGPVPWDPQRPWKDSEKEARWEQRRGTSEPVHEGLQATAIPMPYPPPA